MFEKGIHITKLMNYKIEKKSTAHSNSKKNFRLFDEIRANSIRGKEGTKSSNQKSKTQELF
jgi:hypothetical protein